MLDALLGLLAPPRCLACGAPGEPVLCPACRGALPWLADPCPRCALPRPCAPCPGTGASYASAWAPVAFAGPARALVHALKFDAALPAAGAMAAAMARGVPAGDVLVPVPAAPGRRRSRGFDHAQRLARLLGARTGRPVVACLARDGAERQLGAGRQARLRGPRVRAAGAVPRCDLVLVDDVHTTGGTLDACARALRGHGATAVRAVTYARALTASGR